MKNSFLQPCFYCESGLVAKLKTTMLWWVSFYLYPSSFICHHSFYFYYFGFRTRRTKGTSRIWYLPGLCPEVYKSLFIYLSITVPPSICTPHYWVPTAHTYEMKRQEFSHLRWHLLGYAWAPESFFVDTNRWGQGRKLKIWQRASEQQLP